MKILRASCLEDVLAGAPPLMEVEVMICIFCGHEREPGRRGAAEFRNMCQRCADEVYNPNVPNQPWAHIETPDRTPRLPPALGRFHRTTAPTGWREEHKVPWFDRPLSREA